MKKQIARSSVLRERCLLLLLVVVCPFLSIAQPNLAPSATVTISAGGIGGYGTQHINDGVIDAYNSGVFSWIADGVLPNWMEFTWASPQTVNKIKFYHSDRPLNNGSVQYWDGTDFVTLAPFTRPAGVYESEFVFPTVTTTRLRLMNVRNGGYNPNFREIQISKIDFSIDAPTSFPTTVCAGSTHTVPFTTVGAFMGGTTFKVQLSNPFGSFSSPTDIGTYTVPSFSSPASGNITATIPSTTHPANGYRIRVIHTNTNLISPDNGTNILINPMPLPTLGTTTDATSCSAPNGKIKINSLIINEVFTVNYKKNNVAVTPFDLTSNGSGEIEITGLSAGTYSDIKVTNTSGCTSGSLGPVVLNAPPPPTAPTAANDGPVCVDGTLNLSTTATGVSYSWSGPNTFSSTAQNPSIANITSAANGTYTLTVTDPATGCSNQATTAVVIKAKPVVTAITNKTVCNGVLTTAVGLSADITGTTFAWANNNASVGLATNGTTASVPAFTAINTTNTAAVATITVTPTANGCTGADATYTYTVNPTPVIAAVTNQTTCAPANTTAVTFGSSVSGTTYAWTNNKTSIGLAANGTGDIAAFSATNTTNAPVVATISVTPTANGCAGTAGSYTYTVNPKPTVNAITNQTICNGAATTAVTISGPVSGTTFAWANSNMPIGLAASGNGNIGSFNAVNNVTTATTATVTITPTANGCTGTTGSYTYTVNPTPTVDMITNQSVCVPASTAAVSFSGAVSGTTYNWTNNTTSIGLAASGNGTIPAFATANAGVNPVVATINVTPVANTCAGQAKTFTITANPVVNVNTPNNQTLCNNANTVAANFTGAATGTSFAWTNSNASIGLGASGTGNIAAFTALNTGNTNATATITVTPAANGCTGTSKTYTYTVKPTPSVTPVANQVICANGSTSGVMFGGPVSGTNFAWTNTKAGIGLNSTGTGDIAAFATANPSNLPIVATITVTPTANGCTGPNSTFTYTVNPEVLILPVANQTLCNGATTTATAFSSTALNTTYSWANTNTSIGLAASGTGNIPAFTAVNTTSAPISATITVTPTANGCTGPAKVFTYTVNPTPTVNAVANQTICVPGTTTAVNFTGSVTGTTFGWTNTVSTIGIANAGTGNIGAFAAQNNGGNPHYALVTVTPSANGCVGASTSYTYTVNPVVMVNNISSQVHCNGSPTATVSFSGVAATTVYNWTNSNTSIGLGASGTGNIAPFVAVNTGTAPVTATITVTPVANGCTGTAKTFTYTVNPTPTVNAIADQTLCVPATTTAVNFTSPVSGTTYLWANNQTSIGLGSSGTGNIAAFAAANSTNLPIVATIGVVPTANGCSGVRSTFDITVNPTPTVVLTANQAICNGATTAVVPLTSYVLNSTFMWMNSNPSIGLPASGAGNLPAFQATNNTADPVTATVTVTPSANGCIGNTETYTYVVNPTPKLSSTLAPLPICDSTLFSYVPTSLTAGTAFTWTRAYTPGVSNSSANGMGNVNERLNSATIEPVTVRYVYTLAANNCTNTQNVDVIVNPSPTLSSPVTGEVCSKELFTYTPATRTRNTTFTWKRDAVPGISTVNSNGSGNISESLENITNAAVTVNYVYTLTANNCSATDVLKVRVDALPAVPFINIKPDAGKVFAGTMYQNFGVDTPPAGELAYSWTATNAVVWAQSKNRQNALVSFPNAGSAEVVITNTIPSTGCISKASYKVEVSNAEQIPNIEVVYVNNSFVCLQSNLNYKWGYDKIATLDSTVIAGQVNQNYHLKNPDFENNYYWVITTPRSGGNWVQKTYLRKPTTVDNRVDAIANMQLYPNPASDMISVSFDRKDGVDYQLTLSDVSGKAIRTIPVSGKVTTVDVREIPAGVYMITCFGNGSRIVSSRFVKN